MERHHIWSKRLNTFLSQYEVCDVKLSTSKFTVIIDNKNTRKSITFIRIETKASSSYTKATTQYNNQVLPPLIKMHLLSSVFLNSISTDIMETINWSKNERVSVPAICNYIPSNSSKSTSTSTSPANLPILQSLYPILNSLNINTFDLENKQLDVIYLKNLLSEVSCVLTDNNININLEK